MNKITNLYIIYMMGLVPYFHYFYELYHYKGLLNTSSCHLNMIIEHHELITSYNSTRHQNNEGHTEYFIIIYYI